ATCPSANTTSPARPQELSSESPHRQSLAAHASPKAIPPSQATKPRGGRLLTPPPCGRGLGGGFRPHPRPPQSPSTRTQSPVPSPTQPEKQHPRPSNSPNFLRPQGARM